jgi:hypothetical protein
MPEQDELLSSVGVDYTSLRGLLASGQWQKADEETGGSHFEDSSPRYSRLA